MPPLAKKILKKALIKPKIVDYWNFLANFLLLKFD